MNIQDLLLTLRGAASGLDKTGWLLGVVALVFVVLSAAAVLLVLRLNTPRGRIDALLSERSARRAQPAWIMTLVVLGMFAAALYSAQWYVSRPKTCAQCHRDGKQAAALARSPHAAVPCMDCHQRPGVAGAASQSFTYARWMWVYGTSKREPVPRPGTVDNEACYRCHDYVRSGVTTANGIRVRHSDFLTPGVSCGECHNEVSHPKAVTRPSEPTMSRCLQCHDGTRAPTECTLCHVRDAEPGALPPEFKRVRAVDAKARCYECHQAKTCDSCHGVRMPHPQGWAAYPDGRPGGTHQYAGFKDRELCWRCHNTGGRTFVGSNESCAPCHGLNGKMHGGKPWVKEHSLQATGKKTGELAACYFCHSNDLCTHCHPASYSKLYKPRTGADHYKRDIPFDPSLIEDR